MKATVQQCSSHIYIQLPQNKYFVIQALNLLSRPHPASWFSWFEPEATPARGNPSENNRWVLSQKTKNKNCAFVLYIYLSSGRFKKKLQPHYSSRWYVCVFSVSVSLTYHSQVPDLLHDTRPEGLQGLLGIAPTGSKSICRHPLLCWMEGWQSKREDKVKRWIIKKQKHVKWSFRHWTDHSLRTKDTGTNNIVSVQASLVLSRALPVCQKHKSYHSL